MAEVIGYDTGSDGHRVRVSATALCFRDARQQAAVEFQPNRIVEAYEANLVVGRGLLFETDGPVD